MGLMDITFRHTPCGGFLGAACRVALALVLVLTMVPLPARAETSADVRAQIAQDQAQLDQLTNSVQQKQSDIDALQSQIDDLAQQSMDIQQQLIQDREVLRQIVVSNYKDGGTSLLSIMVSSTSIDDMVSRIYYAQKVSDWQTQVVNRLKDDKDELASQMRQISDAKDQQQAQMDQLNQQSQQMQDTISSLEQKASQLEEQERQAAEAAAEAARQAAAAAAAKATPTTESTDGWLTCQASAYSIADNDPPGSTATASGIPLDDSVPTVALPMTGNPSAHYGQLIEISYNGMSVVARVTDCGDLGGGSRGLDLSTAVYQAFGYSTPDSWGLRTVSYRYL
ncbi:MAG: coiled-coil domain-containing protein [Atopobiaceae bacterium]